MPGTAAPRAGTTLEVRGRVLPFSFYPVTRGNRRYGLYDTVFANNPWVVMRGSVERNVPAASRGEPLAFLAQAEEFYRAASERTAANPLLYYYSFLNLGKALLRARGFSGSLDQAMHGLSERQAPTSASLGMENREVVIRDRGSAASIYPELMEILDYPRPRNNAAFAISALLPQVVVGHRLWRRSNDAERFVSIRAVDFVCDRASQQVWLTFEVPRGDLSRYSITRQRLLQESGLSGTFHEVTGAQPDLLRFELSSPVSYTGRPTDAVMDVVGTVRTKLWRIVTSDPANGYRKYYLHLTPPAESSTRVPQLSSIWMLLFYFGSIVRYRPHLWNELLDGPNGAFAYEFVTAQPSQFLYLLASEMAQREIARPAIV